MGTHESTLLDQKHPWQPAKCTGSTVTTLAITIDLSDNNARRIVDLCYQEIGQTHQVMADLMGVGRSTLAHWLCGKKVIPAWAARAAVFALIASGVPVRIVPLKNWRPK